MKDDEASQQRSTFHSTVRIPPLRLCCSIPKGLVANLRQACCSVHVIGGLENQPRSPRAGNGKVTIPRVFNCESKSLDASLIRSRIHQRKNPPYVCLPGGRGQVALCFNSRRHEERTNIVPNPSQGASNPFSSIFLPCLSSRPWALRSSGVLVLRNPSSLPMNIGIGPWLRSF